MKLIRSISVFLLAAILFSASMVISAAELPFADVKAKAWYYESVAYVYENGLMNGTKADRFEPSAKMTRAMFVTILGRLEGVTPTDSNVFSDVKNGTWYSGYVGWASGAGIVNGYTDGTFKPNRPITRQEAAVSLVRFIEYKGIIQDYLDDVPYFYTDDHTIASWAAYSVDELSMSGLFAGNNGAFKPKSNLSRAECATLLMRIDRMISDAESVSSVLSAGYFMNTPEAFLSNFDSSYADGETASLSLTKYGTAPYYVGIDFKHTPEIVDNGLSFIKFAVKDSSFNGTATLELESPVAKKTLSPVKVSEENGFTVYIFDAAEAVGDIRRANLTETEFDLDENNLVNGFNFKSINSRYFKLRLYAFGDEPSTDAAFGYVGFYSDADSAEKPVEADLLSKDSYTPTEPTYEEISDELLSSFEAEIESRRDEIFNTESELLPSDIKGTAYYISSKNGDDSNDGLSPETAWKTTRNTYTLHAGGIVMLDNILKEGDGIFFERGGVYTATHSSNGRATPYILDTFEGVSVGAYGEGEKPVLTMALDYEGTTEWQATEWENVWLYDGSETLLHKDDTYGSIGNIVVTAKDGTVGHGIQVLVGNREDPYHPTRKTAQLGYVTNGFEVFYSGDCVFDSPGCLKNNLEYFCNKNTGEVFIYCDLGNPANVYESVILSQSGACVLDKQRATDILYDNISFRYGGEFAFYLFETTNLTVQNCTFEWFGGCVQGNNTTIYGGGLQTFNDVDHIVFRNNYANQCLDAAFSTQGSGYIMNDVTIEDCVLLRSNSSIELWNYMDNSPRILSNYKMSNNLCGYTGYHFGNQKVKKDSNIVQLGIAGNTNFILDNVVFNDNLNVHTSSYVYWARPFMTRGDENGFIVHDNIYATSAKKVFMNSAAEMRNNSSDNHYYFYTNELCRMMYNLGMDIGSTFYYYPDYYSADEYQQVYRPPYVELIKP